MSMLSGADLSGADLSEVDLRLGTLSGATLSGARLRGSNLSGADLAGFDLSGLDLIGANLNSANLSGANLSGANLGGADLNSANLSGANLSGANLSEADLSGVNLSGAEGVFKPAAWLQEHFRMVDDGIIVYKAIGETYQLVPDYWKIAPGEYLEEVVNPLPTCDCACGVNFATREWIQDEYKIKIEAGSVKVWECLIEWLDLASVVVPYNTDGKARCERLKPLKIVELFEEEKDAKSDDDAG